MNYDEESVDMCVGDSTCVCSHCKSEDEVIIGSLETELNGAGVRNARVYAEKIYMEDMFTLDDVAEFTDGWNCHRFYEDFSNLFGMKEASAKKLWKATRAPQSTSLSAEEPYKLEKTCPPSEEVMLALSTARDYARGIGRYGTTIRYPAQEEEDNSMDEDEI